MSYRQKVIK